ncbi:MAG: HlyD family secretion protein [Gemmataceae bacterium]
MTPIRELDGSALENGTAPLNARVRSLRLREHPASPPRTAILPWASCVILLLTTVAFGYRAYRVGALTPSLTADPPAAATTPAPTAAAPSASSGEVVLQAKGYVVPAHQVQVSPKVGGMIEKLNERFEKYGEGQFFKEGEALAWLEDDDYKADHDHALHACKAAEQRYQESLSNRPEEIKAALNELKEAQATFEQLDRDLERDKRLFGSSALTAKEFEQAKFARDAMKGRVERLRFVHLLMEKGPRKERQEAARADWDAAKADLVRAEWRLKNCVIRAPISGHILTKKAEKGNVVNPLAFTIASSLCEMADLGDLEIDLSIQERDIARVEKGQRCAVLPEAFQNHQPFRQNHPRGYRGHVIRLMPIADRSKGAINVRVKVEIPEAEVGTFLKPEMSVLVSFLKESE